jgi:transcriptional regulator with XRE-family HTH domain
MGEAGPVPKGDAARGARLRALRTAHGLTQQQVAIKLQVEKSSVSRWEKGTSYPRDYMRQLCEIYETTPTYITFGTDSDTYVTYSAFDEFVKWLDTSPLKASVTPRVLDVVRTTRMSLRQGEEPTVETYRYLLYAALSMQLQDP